MLRVPERLDEDSPIDWVPVWSLNDHVYRYVPAAFAYLSYPSSEPPFCYGDTNGNAAGLTMEAAIVHGFFELVERDAVAIWFYNRLMRPGVDLHGFSDPFFDELISYYRRVLRRDLWVLDVTNDLGIPCFVALSRRLDRKPEDMIMGFGTHFDPHTAVSRALTEVSQVLHNVLEDAPDGTTAYRITDSTATSWLQHVTLESDSYLAPDYRTHSRRPAYYQEAEMGDQGEAMKRCVALARERKLEIFVLNLTREEVGVPVVKVIAPGLVHYWRRLGYRRLYEVPLEMKWLERPLHESELNPSSIFI